MTYDLGIDVGTTYTAAAIARDGGVEAIALATYEVAVPTVVHVDADGMAFGGEAARRGAVNPDGMAREFKRRVGDPVPIILANSPYHADRLTALFARWVRDTVAEQIGGPARRIAVTHPANWTEFQLGLLQRALHDVEMGTATPISEPAAAALDYAAAAALDVGARVLVYDLGGGTFDIALLRRTAEGFEHAITPSGIERLGGIDFDEAVFGFIVRRVPSNVVEGARASPEGRAALQRLRRACVEAKESLSAAAAADVPVTLPGHSELVRITRGEFEDMIRPMVDQTVELVRSTLTRARMTADALDAVLMVGGSSRIPLVPHLVADALVIPVRVDAHPKLVVAKGAARHASGQAPATAARRRAASGAAPAGIDQIDAGEEAEGRGRRVALALGGAMVVLVALIAGVVLFAGGSGDDDADATVPPDTESVTTPTAAPTVTPTTAPPDTVRSTTAPTTPPTVPSDRLIAPASMFTGDRLVSVEDRHVLEMTPSGALQASTDGRVWWSVPDAPVPGSLAIMQFDGNVVIYPDPDHMGGGDSLWNAGTAARGAHLEIIGDGGVGAVVVVGPDGSVLFRVADGG